MVATKAALSIRVDALADANEKSESDAPSIGVAHRAKLESRLRALEYQNDASGVRQFSDSARKQHSKFEMTGETKTYNTKADAVELVSTQREDPMAVAAKIVEDVKEEKRRAKEERKARKAEKAKEKKKDEDAMDVDEKRDKKKDKKRKRKEDEMDVDIEETKAEVSFQFISICSLTLDSGDT